MVDAGGKVIAVLDWEICTLGDPLADVGLLMVYWTDPDDASPALLGGATALEGFLRRAELLDRYAELSGRDLSGIDYYVAFGYWKLACIIEGVYARYKGGAMGDRGGDVGAFDFFGEQVESPGGGRPARPWGGSSERPVPLRRAPPTSRRRCSSSCSTAGSTPGSAPARPATPCWPPPRPS